MKRVLFLTLLLSLILPAEGFKIAAVAGYKQPITAVVKAFEQETNSSIDLLFSNMQQSIQHAKSGDIALIIGDKSYLTKKSLLSIDTYTQMGYGKVVVAFARNIDVVDTNLSILIDNKITKIAMPQPQKAIYGVAGEEMLKTTALYDQVKDKLYIVATVPQVVTYLITGEVEAGIINLTAYLANKEKLGKMIEINSKLYTPIEIVAGSLKGCDTECQAFITFLDSPKAKEILSRYGL